MASKPSMFENYKDELIIIATAMAAGMVRYAKTCQHERFTLANLIIGLASSGLIGYISYGVCDIFGVSAIARSAIAAMCGYSGSTLLDALHTGLIEAIGKFFDSMLKKMSGGHRGE